MSTTVATHPSNLRSLSPWYLAVILHSFAVTLYMVAIFDFADSQLHASASTRLWMMALYGFAYIFIALASGKLTTRWGSRKTLLLMLPLCAVAELLSLLIFLAPASAAAPWLLAALMLPVNIASTTCWPALESAVSRSPGSMRLSTRMSVYNLCWSLPYFAAIFARGTLEHTAWPLIFIVPAAVTCCTCVLLATWAIPESMLGKQHVPEESAGETDLDSPRMRQRATTLLHMAWMGNALSYFAINVLLAVLLLLADAAWLQHYDQKVPLTIAGFVTSAWGFTRAAGFFLAMKTNFWHYKARWLVGSQLTLAGSFLIMLTIHNPFILILSQILFGLATALVYTSSLYYAMHTSEGSGEHAGFHEALIGIGICLGPAIGAIAGAGTSLDIAAQLTSLHRVAYAVTGLLVLGTVFMAILGMRHPRTPGTLPVDVDDSQQSHI